MVDDRRRRKGQLSRRRPTKRAERLQLWILRMNPRPRKYGKALWFRIRFGETVQARPRKKVRKVNPKRARERRIYNARTRPAFLESHPCCEAAGVFFVNGHFV